jgi:thiamine pyrophosphate-dependent acetolactate synthase large subunit-like protein
MTSNEIGGHAAIAVLEAYGVDTIFGIPGVHTLDLYRGIADRGMRHIGVRHEQGAGFMADGYARASGKPGVCCLITGPGLLNAATPLGQAYSDSVPVMVICSVNAQDDLGKGRGRLHEMSDQRASIAPVTAFARTIRDSCDLPQAVADSFAVFETQRPRPVVLEMPLDVLAAPSQIRSISRIHAKRPLATSADLKAAAELIDGAHSVLVLAGGGASDCAPAVRAFVEKIGALCVTTTAGKGIMPDQHPSNLGATLAFPVTQNVLAEVDLVVAVGTELAETDSWIDRLPIPSKLLRIDIDAYTLTRDYTPTIGLLADAGPTLEALMALVQRQRVPDTALVANIRGQIRQSLSPLQRKHQRVLEVLRAATAEDAIFASDMTQIAYTANSMFPVENPRTWLHPCGFGTLGYGVPAAIGAQIACPGRQVVAIAGDGGFLFTGQELGTAVEQKLPVAIILWNNEAFGQISNDMVQRGIEEVGVKPHNPDYVKLAEAFGAYAVRPDSAEALAASIREAFAKDGPTLIEVREDAPYLAE